MVGLGSNATMADAEEFAATGGIESFPMLWDESFEAWTLFGVSGTPAAMLIAGDGTPIKGWLGPFPEDEVLALAAQA